MYLPRESRKAGSGMQFDSIAPAEPRSNPLGLQYWVVLPPQWPHGDLGAWRRFHLRNRPAEWSQSFLSPSTLDLRGEPRMELILPATCWMLPSALVRFKDNCSCSACINFSRSPLHIWPRSSQLWEVIHSNIIGRVSFEDQMKLLFGGYPLKKNNHGLIRGWHYRMIFGSQSTSRQVVSPGCFRGFQLFYLWLGVPLYFGYPAW